MSEDSKDSLFFPKNKDDFSSPQYRLGIGLLGFLLPFLLILTAGVKPVKWMGSWEQLTSISAYYYTEGTFYFVGILIALGVFLIMYRGYGNNHRFLDRWAVIIAGIASMGVAIFPCKPPKLIIDSGWQAWMGTVHYVCAAVMFFAFIFISCFLFTKSKPNDQDSSPAGKPVRNFLYRLLGVLMLACMVWIFFIRVVFNTDGSIFWPEALAVMFFALSWLLKGRADYFLAKAGSRAVFYLGHPGKLMGK